MSNFASLALSDSRLGYSEAGVECGDWLHILVKLPFIDSNSFHSRRGLTSGKSKPNADSPKCLGPTVPIGKDVEDNLSVIRNTATTSSLGMCAAKIHT